MTTIDRYEVGEAIGHGGMAIVYIARQVDLDREVALKELRLLQAPDDPALAQRFLREARVVGSLGHPNIVTVHEYFEHEGTPYIAMEYLRRGSLRPWVGRMSLAQVCGVLEGVLAALDHAESCSIVHRDLKPENLLVSDQGQVKVADFGIAKARTVENVTNLTAAGTTVGTPSYMAPEQAMAGDIGPYTDLYAVGVMAFEMLVGRTPFADTDSPMAVMMRHINEVIPPAHTVDPSIDPGISAWIESLLVKESDGRVQSSAEAWDVLEEVVLRLLGSRWRREARLVGTAEQPAAKPLTPAPFTSTGAETPVPDSDGFKTYGEAPPAQPPPPAPPPPVPPPPEPEPEPPPEREPTRAPTPAPVPVAATATPPRPTRALPATESAPAARRRGLLLLVPLLAVIAVVVALVAGGSGDDGASGGGSGTAPQVAATIEVGDTPDGIAVGANAVWVLTSRDEKLSRIDSQTNEVTGTADAGPAPDSVAVAEEEGDLFVTAQGDEDRVLRFAGKTTPDPAGGRDVGSVPEDLDIADGTIWVALSGAGQVQRLAVDTNSAIGEPVPVGEEPIGVDVGDGRVWVANSGSGTVSRIDAESAEPLGEPVEVGENPRDLVEGYGFAWVVLTDEDAVVRLDLETGEPVGEPIPVGANPHKVAAGQGAVWVTNSGDDTVSQIDPTEFRTVGDPIAVGDSPLGIATGQGAVWVTNRNGGTVSRITPGTPLASGG